MDWKQEPELSEEADAGALMNSIMEVMPQLIVVPAIGFEIQYTVTCTNYKVMNFSTVENRGGEEKGKQRNRCIEAERIRGLRRGASAALRLAQASMWSSSLPMS